MLILLRWVKKKVLFIQLISIVVIMLQKTNDSSYTSKSQKDEYYQDGRHLKVPKIKLNEGLDYFKEEIKCKLKVGTSYKNIKFSVRKEDNRLYIVFAKIQSGKVIRKITDKQIKLPLIDEKKIILSLHQHLREGNQTQDQNCLKVKFQNHEEAQHFYSLIYSFMEEKKDSLLNKEVAQMPQKRTDHKGPPLVISIIEEYQYQIQLSLAPNATLAHIIKILKEHYRFQFEGRVDQKDSKIKFKEKEVQYQQRINSLTIEKQASTEFIRQLENQIQTIIAEKKTLHLDTANKQGQIVHQLMQQIRQKDEKLKTVQLNLRQDISKLQQQLLCSQAKVEKYKQLADKAQINQKVSESKYQALQKSHQKLKKSISHQDLLIKNLKKQVNDLERKMGQRQISFKKEDENLQLKKMSEQSELMMKKAQRRYQEMFAQFRMKEKELQKLKGELEKQIYLHIFEGKVLENYTFLKQFLKNQLQNYTKKKILKSRIIYKYDTKNTVNFHHYIDGHPHIVLIIKTVEGFFLAGYSESPIKNNQKASKGGLILSLTNQKTFELIPKLRSVTYDDYFLIFGNSEIRIKSLQNKVFSNFGVANGYFTNKGQTVNTLLGQDISRQVLIQNYQVHELIFR